MHCKALGMEEHFGGNPNEIDNSWYEKGPPFVDVAQFKKEMCGEWEVRVFYPAYYDGVVSVASYGPTGSRAFYSNYGDEIEQHAKMIAHSVETPNEARVELGMGKPYTEGDKFYIGTSLVTIGEPSEPLSKAEKDLMDLVNVNEGEAE